MLLKLLYSILAFTRGYVWLFVDLYGKMKFMLNDDSCFSIGKKI